MISKEFFDQLPKEIQDAIDVFTDEELAMLSSFVDHETQDFIGIGFVDPATGLITKFADPVKYDAILVLEQRIQWELNELKKGQMF